MGQSVQEYEDGWETGYRKLNVLGNFKTWRQRRVGGRGLQNKPKILNDLQQNKQGTDDKRHQSLGILKF